MNKKILVAILTGSFIFAPINFAEKNLQNSVAHAELKNYSASDVALLDFGENDSRVADKVKKIAKQRAIEAARGESRRLYQQFFADCERQFD